MADIFLSYSRADRPTAQMIAEALKADGFTVWWDKVLRAGQTYDEVTENMLRDSSVVIVLWSHTSVKSKWVRAEATLGERSSIVIPAMIEDADRPIMFELTQSADLIGWAGDRTEPRWHDFVADIRRALEKQAAESAPVETVAAPAEPQNDATIETVFWTSIKDGSNPADFEAYLKRYPAGHYSDLARNRLAAMAAPATPTAPAQTAASAAPLVSEQIAQSEFPMKFVFATLGVLALGLAGWGASAMLSGSSTDTDEPAETASSALQCDTCPEMIAIPAGTFTMGSPDSEPNRVGNESPQRSVTLAAFHMSKYEITYAQWAACVADNACRATAKVRGDNMPIPSINWNDTQSYARWLSSKTGKAYRLPTEAEWEYAARGGTEAAYWWGAQFDSSIATSGSPRDVTTLAENPYGLVGMNGNLREWVEDW